MEYYTEKDGYFVIPTESLLVNKVTDFDLYINVNGNYVYYRSKDIPFDRELKDNLIESDTDYLYVDVDDIEKYKKYLEDNLSEIITNQKTSFEKRGKILYFYSTHLLKEVMEEPRVGNNISKTQELVKNTVNFLVAGKRTFKDLLKLVKYDYYTYTHSVNVCLFSIGLAEKVNIEDKDELNRLGIGAILHDIGKSKIDKNILNKRGPLTKKEWEIMKKHPIYGAEICEETRMIPEESYSAILEHHEKCNGKGYPRGLKKDDIHLFGKIVSIGDVFDALTTNRSYAFATKPFSALKIMKKEMNGCFDLDLFREFIILLGTSD